MAKTRRENLKIIGAISATCAFPFSADELYGQHSHAPGKQAKIAPKVFSPDELITIGALADVIIPSTDTPGASDAEVPAYIDLVASGNKMVRETIRSGLALLDNASRAKYGSPFHKASEQQQIEMIEPLAAADKPQSELEKFFAVFKSVTADGYYSSEIGLVKELGYAGNTVLGSFPECAVPEH